MRIMKIKIKTIQAALFFMALLSFSERLSDYIGDSGDKT
jgi:hypothetical protein